MAEREWARSVLSEEGERLMMISKEGWKGHVVGIASTKPRHLSVAAK